MSKLDVAAIRHQFPILNSEVNGKPLVYFDNAASSQKPQVVIDAVTHCYREQYANVHRGLHTMSERTSQAFEDARRDIQSFINATKESEVIFTRGTTDSINLVAASYGRENISAGDEILISAMEHHSNIVPWQMLCEQTGAVLKVIAINELGELDLESFNTLLSEKTKLVAITHVSNALGTINPVEEIIEKAHALSVPVLLDGAQAAPHMQVDVQALDVDFYAFSAHKAFGPSGVGVLYGKEKLLEAMPPYQGGGEMIRYVTFEKTDYAPLPFKFEAGTPNIAGAIGFGAAVKYLQQIGMDKIASYEAELLSFAMHALSEIQEIKFIGTAKHKAAVISFNLGNVHAHDVGTILDTHGVAVRSGHHCAMPVMQFFDVPATIRASFAFYNTREEVEVLIQALLKVREVFKSWKS